MTRHTTRRRRDGGAACGGRGAGALRCSSYDDLALRLIEHLQSHGVRVPDDVSVAGFDDIPLAALSRPSLSTVRQPIIRLGERAAELLLERIEGGSGIPAGHREFLPTELVLRESTAAPPPA